MSILYCIALLLLHLLALSSSNAYSSYLILFTKDIIMTFEALIWDCDGCLIDSEHISCGHMADVFTEAGYPISINDFVRLFAGQGGDRMTKLNIDPELQNKIRENTKAKAHILTERFRNELKVIENIEAVLEQINLPMAVASGSAMDRLALTLQLTNLYDGFNGHIYSSSLVPKGKPAPDIFLYAAEKLNTAPEKCLVIEDSLNGVRSGKAAGMTVFGFTGGSHVFDKVAHHEELLYLGADLVFDEMNALPRLIAAYQIKQTNKGEAA